METVITRVSEATGDDPGQARDYGNGATRAYLFGPFHFIPARRILLRENIPQRIGGRAIDILTILLEHRNEPVSKRELIARVWPCTVVEDCNLKVNISTLRRTLGEFREGSPYIATINGRGYCFVAPVDKIKVDLADAQDPERIASLRAALAAGTASRDCLEERLTHASRALNAMQAHLNILRCQHREERHRLRDRACLAEERLAELEQRALQQAERERAATERLHARFDATLADHAATIAQIRAHVAAVQHAVDVLNTERDRERTARAREQMHRAMPQRGDLYLDPPRIDPACHGTAPG